MKPIQDKTVTLLSSLAMLLALGACDRTEDHTVGERVDSGISKAQQAGAEAKRDAKDATARAGAAAESAADSTRQMGAAAGAKVDDASITAKVSASLAAD